MLPKPRNHWALIALLVDILRLPDETAALAYKFYNIFKTNTLTGPALAFDDYTIALASLFQACKTTESPRQLTSLISAAYRLLHPTAPPPASDASNPANLKTSTHMNALRKAVIDAQMILLRILKFDCLRPTPYDFLRDYLSHVHRALSCPTDGTWKGIERFERWSDEEKRQDRVVEVWETPLGRRCRERALDASRAAATEYPQESVTAAVIHTVLLERGVVGEDDAAKWLSEVIGAEIDKASFEATVKFLQENCTFGGESREVTSREEQGSEPIEIPP